MITYWFNVLPLIYTSDMGTYVGQVTSCFYINSVWCDPYWFKVSKHTLIFI